MKTETLKSEAELAALALRIVKRDTECVNGQTATDRIIDANIKKFAEAVRRVAGGLCYYWSDSQTECRSYRFCNLKNDIKFLEETLAATVKAVQALIGELKAVSEIVDGSEAPHE